MAKVDVIIPTVGTVVAALQATASIQGLQNVKVIELKSSAQNESCHDWLSSILFRNDVLKPLRALQPNFYTTVFRSLCCSLPSLNLSYANLYIHYM